MQDALATPGIGLNTIAALTVLAVGPALRDHVPASSQNSTPSSAPAPVPSTARARLIAPVTVRQAALLVEVLVSTAPVLSLPVDLMRTMYGAAARAVSLRKVRGENCHWLERSALSRTEAAPPIHG